MKNIKIWLPIVIGCVLLVAGTLFGVDYVKSRPCSQEKLVSLMKECPSMINGNMASLPEPAPLKVMAEYNDAYVKATVIDKLSDSNQLVEDTVLGNSTAMFTVYKIKVDEFIAGKQIVKEGETIEVSISKALPMPDMKAGNVMVLPISASESGEYIYFDSCAYYVADGYVVATFKESKDSVYTGETYYTLKKALKRFK